MAHDVLTPELEREIAEARRADAEAAANEPRAVTVDYDAGRHEVVIEFIDGARLAIPADNIQGLKGAQPEDLAQIEVTPTGSGIRWETLDVDLSVPGLVAGVFGTRTWMAGLGRRGGVLRATRKPLRHVLTAAKGDALGTPPLRQHASGATSTAQALSATSSFIGFYQSNSLLIGAKMILGKVEGRNCCSRPLL